MKVQVKRALKGYFFGHQKSNKKANKFGMKFSSTSNIVHELEPKEMGICLAGKQNIIYIFSNLRVSTFWKSMMSSVQISSFWKKIEVFYRPEWTKIMKLKMNFQYFQIQK